MPSRGVFSNEDTYEYILVEDTGEFIKNWYNTLIKRPVDIWENIPANFDRAIKINNDFLYFNHSNHSILIKDNASVVFRPIKKDYSSPILTNDLIKCYCEAANQPLRTQDKEIVLKVTRAVRDLAHKEAMKMIANLPLEDFPISLDNFEDELYEKSEIVKTTLKQVQQHILKMIEKL